MDGGGGGGGQQQAQPTTSTVNNVSVPPELMPYAQRVLGQGEALTNINMNPYQQYGNSRVAGFSPLQSQAFQNIGNMQPAGQIGAGTGMAAMGGIGSLGAGQQYNQMATNPGAVGQFMSPYMQDAVDWQKQQALNDYGRQLPGMNAAATRAGAFGGTRQAVVESEGQRNLQNQLGGIQAQGTQSAFDNAMKSMQFGNTMGLQGYGQGIQAAGAMGQLGQTQYGQQTGINQAQQQAGAQQQALEQQGLSNQYQDFLNQQNYPYRQLGFMSDLVRGMPLTTQSSSVYQAPPNNLTQSIGLLGGIGSMAAGFGMGKGSAAGGAIKGFAGGGLTSASDPQLAQMMQSPQSMLRYILAEQEVNNRALIRAQPTQPVPQSTIIEQEMGLGSAGAPQTDPLSQMADGGIVGFDTGGRVSGFTPEEEKRFFPSRASEFGRLARDAGVGVADRLLFEPGRRFDADVDDLIKGARRTPSYLFGPNIPTPEDGKVPAGTVRGPIRPAPAGSPGYMSDSQAIAQQGLGQGAAPPGAGPQAPPGAGPQAAPAAPGAGQQRAAPAEAGRVNPYNKHLDAILAGEGPKTLSREELTTRTDAERKAAMAKVGITDGGENYKAQLDALTNDAKAAVQDRDRDRLFALAQGFFAMGAGTSPHASVNVAAGFGMGVKQFQALEKDFIEMGKLRRQEMVAVQQRAAAGAEGNLKAVDAADTRQQALAVRHESAKQKALAELSINWNTTETRRVVAEEATANRGARATETAAYQKMALEQRGDSKAAALQQREEQMLLEAIKNEKMHLLKANPMAAMDPSAADAIHATAVQNVRRMYPEMGTVMGTGSRSGPPPDIQAMLAKYGVKPS